jgi:hypothetical protein
VAQRCCCFLGPAANHVRSPTPFKHCRAALLVIIHSALHVDCAYSIVERSRFVALPADTRSRHCALAGRGSIVTGRPRGSCDSSSILSTRRRGSRSAQPVAVLCTNASARRGAPATAGCATASTVFDIAHILIHLAEEAIRYSAFRAHICSNWCEGMDWHKEENSVRVA